MIDKKTAEAIKKDIGGWYVSRIVAYSKKKGYKKENGSFHTQPEFSMALNQTRSNAIREGIILECWEYYIKKNEKAKKKKAALLKRSKQNA